MESRRDYSGLDRLLMNAERGLHALLDRPPITERPNPADPIPEAELSTGERRHSARLMRVNHAGEVAAQGLYQGQALTAQRTEIREHMERAAAEEADHLAWCAQRLTELHGRGSHLNPLWYAGALAIGAVAGLAGDKWSLGFIAETERQVVWHLEDQLRRLPGQDRKSRAILEQMAEDEAYHATTAHHAGGAELPEGIKTLMRLSARLMTRSAYWV